MPSLKDLLKKKEKIEAHASQPQEQPLKPPEFTFIRSTTSDFETILTIGNEQQKSKPKQSGEHKRTLGFRNSFHSGSSKESAPAPTTPATSLEVESGTRQLPVRPKSERRLSDVLHLTGRSRSRSNTAETSANLPTDLPDAPDAAVRSRAGTIETDNDNEAGEQREALWEKRATVLAMNSPLRDDRIMSETGSTGSTGRPKSVSISDATGDVNIQDAIKLHEAGDLVRSTEMFGQLADPDGANNALAQVLFGLALRHGKQGEVKGSEGVGLRRSYLHEDAFSQPALDPIPKSSAAFANSSLMCSQAGAPQ